MGIKLSTDTISSVGPADRLQAGFILILGGLLTALKRVILPYMVLAAVLWLLTVYASYKTNMTTAVLPIFLAGPVWCLLMLTSAAGALGYAFLLSAFWALKEAAAYAEDFFYQLFENLKDHIRNRIDNMEAGVAKQQAKVILDNSIREVLAPLKALRLDSALRVLAVILLAILTFVSRAVFLARLARLTGASIHFSAIFASRATLVGALFLNMRWLSALVLGALYAVGIGIFLIDLWIIW